MSSKTKIVVLRMKELIYTAIFVGLGIVLVILLVYMFFPKKGAQETSAKVAEASYIPGVYHSAMTLGGQTVDVEVTVDADHINGIRIVDLNETVTTMFPLMQPAIDSLEEQICSSQSLDNLSYSADSKYTSMALVKTIKAALGKAAK